MSGAGSATPRPRIAYLTYSTGLYDSRTQRMAAAAVERGFSVTVYARWEPGVPFETAGPGYRIVRVPVVAELAIPGLRGRGRRRLASIRRQATTTAGGPIGEDRPASTLGSPTGPEPRSRADVTAGPPRRWVDRLPGALRGTIFGWPFRRARMTSLALGRWRRRLLLFPIRPIAWAIALEEVVDGAEIWHGMWATSLPCLARLRSRRGGRAVYDARDIYIHARGMEAMARPWKWLLGGLERRWARRMDAILTVNEPYADILERQLGVPRPTIVRNTPRRYLPPTPPPDRFRDLLGLPASVSIVLYQGGLMSDRGIEQGMEAILDVREAILVLMGFGSQEGSIARSAASPRYAARVRMVEPVPPAELLDWTASADVMLVAIQPTSLNHRYSTPTKLWEAIAAGVPVVASDLPGMAAIVRETGCGVLVDPTDPADIARGIQGIIGLAPAARAALRDRCRTAGSIYAWEHEAGHLFEVYDRLLRQAPRPVLPYGGS